jgi:hypothetical protein
MLNSFFFEELPLLSGIIVCNFDFHAPASFRIRDKKMTEFKVMQEWIIASLFCKKVSFFL